MKTSWIATLAVVVILTLWMLSGLFAEEKPDTTSPASEADELPMAVEVVRAKSSPMAREIALNGQLEPVRRVRVKAQTSGEVSSVFVQKGARVDLGQELVKLDEGGRGNSLAEAQAAVKSARSAQAAALSLQRQRLQSTLQLEQAEAALESARAMLASVELDIEYTTISSPFPGVVNDLPVDIGELIERGDVIAEIIDDSSFKMSAHIAQLGRSQLRMGQSVTVKLITGETLEGSITFIAAAADPQTRSFAVEARVQNDGNAAAGGVSATMYAPVEEVQAIFITPSAMSLDTDGTLGVKIVDDEQRVVFLPIELVSSTLDGAWVTGIPDQSRIITLGQGFVTPGDQVRAQLMNDPD